MTIECWDGGIRLQAWGDVLVPRLSSIGPVQTQEQLRHACTVMVLLFVCESDGDVCDQSIIF